MLILFAWVIAIGCGLAMIAGACGRWHALLELAAHFRIQYAIALLTATAALAALKRWRDTAAVAILLFIAAAPLVRDWIPQSPPQASATATTFLLSNVRTSNTRSDLLRQLIRAESPDVVALLEVNQRWWDELAPIREIYPFDTHQLRNDNFGIALLSKQPLTNVEIIEIPGIGVPTILCDIRIEDHPCRLIVTHPLPPGSTSSVTDRNRQLAEIAKWAAAHDCVMVLGDLNVTPWSPYFADLLRDGNLRDSRRGHGVQATWPALPAPLRIPIDHALTTHNLTITSRKVAPSIASDHRPIFISIRPNHEPAP